MRSRQGIGKLAQGRGCGRAGAALSLLLLACPGSPGNARHSTHQEMPGTHTPHPQPSCPSDPRGFSPGTHWGHCSRKLRPAGHGAPRGGVQGGSVEACVARSAGSKGAQRIQAGGGAERAILEPPGGPRSLRKSQGWAVPRGLWDPTEVHRDGWICLLRAVQGGAGTALPAWTGPPLGAADPAGGAGGRGHRASGCPRPAGLECGGGWVRRRQRVRSCILSV